MANISRKKAPESLPATQFQLRDRIPSHRSRTSLADTNDHLRELTTALSERLRTLLDQPTDLDRAQARYVLAHAERMLAKGGAA